LHAAAFLLCGGLAPAGAILVSGVFHKLVPSVSGGYGFLGILVVLLAGYRAAWIAPISFFFAAVAVGSTQLSLRLDLDSSLGGVLQGVLVLFVILFGGWRARRTRWRTALMEPWGPHGAGGAIAVEATLATIVASASALVYAVVGETITEKAGVVNLSMEGTIMLSAMTGFAVAYTTGSVLLGFLAAAGVGMLIAALVAFASIEMRLNQIAVGFVMTLLAIELSSFLGDPYVGQHGPSVRAMPIPLLSDIPFLGRVLFRHNLSVYGSYLAYRRRLPVRVPHAPRPRDAGRWRAGGRGVRPRDRREPAPLPVYDGRRRAGR
jgi:ABC-type uncharacterized transport system permease subunit